MSGPRSAWASRALDPFSGGRSESWCRAALCGFGMPPVVGRPAGTRNSIWRLEAHPIHGASDQLGCGVVVPGVGLVTCLREQAVNAFQLVGAVRGASKIEHGHGASLLVSGLGTFARCR